MIWYCGGHVACPTSAGDPKVLQRAGLAWLNRWLRPDAIGRHGPRVRVAGRRWRLALGTGLSARAGRHARRGRLRLADAGREARARSRDSRAARCRRPGPSRRRFSAPSSDVDVVGDPTRTRHLPRSRQAGPHVSLRTGPGRRRQARRGRPGDAAAGHPGRTPAHRRSPARGARPAADGAARRSASR